MEPKRLYRSRERMLGGVCGGVADYFGFDKTIARLIFAALVLAGTVGFWLYLLMWIIVPEEPSSEV
ncbi:MAG TPA: PspC domain-containing protein [Bacteroidales bacterium]|nr:PspC domain-containing protein [Bacteroidales bacterium]